MQSVLSILQPYFVRVIDDSCSALLLHKVRYFTVASTKSFCSRKKPRLFYRPVDLMEFPPLGSHLVTLHRPLLYIYAFIHLCIEFDSSNWERLEDPYCIFTSPPVSHHAIQFVLFIFFLLFLPLLLFLHTTQGHCPPSLPSPPFTTTYF